jgi:glycosyltransferase involved in cell wall biosynthesis
MGRLAIVMNMLAPYWVDVFERLAELGWEIRVIVGVEKEPSCRYDMNDVRYKGFGVKRCANLVLNLERLPGRSAYLHLPYGLWRELRGWRPDIVLTSELGLRTLIAAGYGRIHGVPVIPWVCVSSHTERNNSSLRESFRRRMLHGFPVVCTNMGEAGEYLVNKLGVSPGKIFHTPYTIDVEKYGTLVAACRNGSREMRNKLGLEGIVFLYVGHMIPRKGIRELALGIGELTPAYRERCSFLFVGGEMPTEVVELLDHGRVRYACVPFVQPRELPCYYAAADVFLFPSLEDEWGIVLNEAAASGLPLAASRFAAATAELVQPGNNGVVFNPHDSREVAGMLSTIIDLPESRLREWGANSVTAAKSIGLHFTVHNLVSALECALSRYGADNKAKAENPPEADGP